MAIYIGALVLTGWLSCIFPMFLLVVSLFSYIVPVFSLISARGERIFSKQMTEALIGVRGTKPCGRAVKINNLMKDLYYLD